MRPIAFVQDPLRYPLNEILGTQAHVRLLRVMANEVEGPLTAADAAQRAGLTVPGAQKALEKLVRSGFVSRVGGGRKHQYEIRRSDRLMQIVVELFQVEKSRYEQLLAAIRKEINNLAPPPQSAWIQAAPKEIDEPLTLRLLHGSLHLTKCVRQLRAGLHNVEKEFDLTIELEGYTKADISDLEIGGVTVLYGFLPQTPDGSAQRQAKKAPTHREKDRQLNVLCRKLADVLEKDASLVRRAKNHIDRMLNEDQGAATADIEEWRNILDTYSIQRLARFFTSSSERANRLRQSNPFLAILDPAERAQVTGDLRNMNDPRST
ncbi:MAG: MarR family transcriptional regulator [Pseudomonadota bacterium]